MRSLALLVLAPALVLAQAPSAPTSTAPSAPPQAAVEKLGEGDRLYLAGDYRNALFAYQDATYIAPRHAPAHVRLGRAYLALRYPDKAIEQAELAIAEDPEAPDARKLLEEARAQAESGGGAVASPLPAVASPAPARPGPKSYKLSPPAEEAKPASAPRALTATAIATPAPTPAAPPAGDPEAAAAHYRTAIGLLQNRDWKEAARELTTAISLDPKLAVAYSARGSALFGLGRYGDAADDYQRSVSLDPNLATPLYGLAECYRVLGDNRKAAEAYEKYARSTASDVREDLRATAAKRAQELK
jgi:tetratricopeptide (TPR) repeat protein